MYTYTPTTNRMLSPQPETVARCKYCDRSIHEGDAAVLDDGFWHIECHDAVVSEEED